MIRFKIIHNQLGTTQIPLVGEKKQHFYNYPILFKPSVSSWFFSVCRFLVFISVNRCTVIVILLLTIKSQPGWKFHKTLLIDQTIVNTVVCLPWWYFLLHLRFKSIPGCNIIFLRTNPPQIPCRCCIYHYVVFFICVFGRYFLPHVFW